MEGPRGFERGEKVSDFTVAICTYNRADLLPETLASLAAVDRPDAAWEVLVVDNACDDQVRVIVEGFKGKLDIRYVAEPEVGIARARNRAVGETRSPIILFADDDVQFDRGWLCAMVNAVRQHNDCDFWGGRIEPVWTVEQPAWFDIDRCPMLGDSVVRYDVGREPRAWDPAADPPFYTCNLGLRVEAIKREGLFDVTLGHQGKKRGGGEDSWMIKAISRSGGKGWYAADAALEHPVPPQRVTLKHARAFAWWQGRVGVDMLRREHAAAGQLRGRTPRWLYRVAVEQLFKGVGWWAAGVLKRDAGLAFTGQFTALFNLSKLWHALKR